MATKTMQVIVKEIDMTPDDEGDLVFWIEIPADCLLIPVDGAFKVSDIGALQYKLGVDLRVERGKQ